MSVLRHNYYHIWPLRVAFRFLVENSNDPHKYTNKNSAFSLMPHLCRDKFLVVIDICADVQKNSRPKEINHSSVIDHADEIIDICSLHGFQGWTSNNSWDHEEHPMRGHSLEELHEIIEDSDTFGYAPHKRLLVGRELQSSEYEPKEFVVEIVETLKLLKQEFLDESGIFEDVFQTA